MIALLNKYRLGILIGVLFIGAVFSIYSKLHPNVLPDNLIQGTGRIDGDLVNLNAKYPGRIVAIDVREGGSVRKRQDVARIDSREFMAQNDQIKAQLEAKRGELRAREIELDVLRRSLPLSLSKAQANLAMNLRTRDELDQTINTQKSVSEQSERDMERMRDLVEKRLIEVRQLETARLKYQSDRDQLSALLFKRQQLDEAIRIAESTRAEAAALQGNVMAMEEANKALVSGIKALEASKAQSDAVLSEMVLRSPLDGFVVETIAHSGEVIGAGSPLMTLIDPGTLYLKIFVDTLKNGKIKVGDSAVIFADAYPDRPIKAKVVRIEQKAEFTPKEVSVASDRIQRVYAVHLRPLRPDPLLKLGLPAIGVISLDGKSLPTSLRDIPE